MRYQYERANQTIRCNQTRFDRLSIHELHTLNSLEDIVPYRMIQGIVFLVMLVLSFFWFLMSLLLSVIHTILSVDRWDASLFRSSWFTGVFCFRYSFFPLANRRSIQPFNNNSLYKLIINQISIFGFVYSLLDLFWHWKWNTMVYVIAQRIRRTEQRLSVKYTSQCNAREM